MDEALQVIDLPLFPLKTVLFPGQMLPLHIFEQRYRTMIRRCLADESPFGVVLIRKGQEVGEQAEPHEVGTVSRIVESTHLPDGTMNIITVGTDRFRIRQLFHDQPYLRGQVEIYPLPEPSDPERTTVVMARVREQVASYIKLIAEAAGLQIQLEAIPESPQQVGYVAAVAMQIDNEEKQEILSSPSLDRILQIENRLLNRENALLTWMVGTKEWPEQVQMGPSGTLLPN